MAYILGRKGVGQVLLVGKNENGDSGEFFVFDEFVHLNSSLFYTLLIGTVNDVNLKQHTHTQERDVNVSSVSKFPSSNIVFTSIKEGRKL